MRIFGWFSLGAVLLLMGCPSGNAYNPANVGPNTANTSVTYTGVSEQLTADVLYGGGPTAMTYNGFYGCGAAPLGSAAISSAAGRRSSASVTVSAPGIGGIAGDFVGSHYVLYKGFQGPSAALDYCHITIPLKAGGSDLTCYSGFIFYARGHGNYGVQLDTLLTQSTGYNHYEKVFGSQLSDNRWTEITVRFSDMQQLFGRHVDQIAVLKSVLDIQIQQETPFTSQFELDLDYIRFFR